MFAGARASAGDHRPGEWRVDFTDMDRERIVHGAAELEDAAHWDIENGVSIRIVGNPYFNRAAGVGDHNPIPCGRNAHIFRPPTCPRNPARSRADQNACNDRRDIPTLTPHDLHASRFCEITPTRTNSRMTRSFLQSINPMTRLNRGQPKRSSDVQTCRRVFRSRSTRAERR
jgi:hypothetical protein